MISISRYFIGVRDSNFSLREFKIEKNRVIFNLLLELQNETLKEERYKFHKNQYTAGYFIIEFNTPQEDGSKFKRMKTLPFEYSKLTLQTVNKECSYMYGIYVQLDPLKYGLTHVDCHTPSILINLT